MSVRNDNWELGSLGTGMFRIGLVVGILALAASFGLGLTGESPDRFYHAYLTNFVFFLTLALGGYFFVIISHLTGSTWSVVVRRLAEGIAGNLWVMAILFVPIIFGMQSLYSWAVPENLAHDALLQGKEPYLNKNFFIVRSAIYFVAWIAFSQYFLKRSLGQDKNSEIKTTLGMERTSAVAVLVFALTTTFAAFDYLMSLDPYWFSTIFGVYFFAGSMWGFFALLPLIVTFLRWKGRMQSIVSLEHFHDMGKWMFAFTVFWAYIGFSQYFLIWYANIPEEITWYAVRQSEGWVNISWLMLIGHFIVPFGGLLPRWVKKTTPVLAFWSIYCLALHWFDIFWLSVPHAYPGEIPWSILDLTCFVGMGGIFVALAARRLTGNSLVPAGDPRLPDSIAFENV